MKKTIIGNCLLVLTYIFLIVILLEIILRIGGLTYNFIHSSDYDKDADFVILSIGESTTLGLGVSPDQTYSKQLEHLLNNNSRSLKFTVINKGRVSQMSSSILRNIDNQMIKYQPDLVISLFGVNDFNEHLNNIHSIRGSYFKPFYNLRVYKLFSILIEYFNEGIKFKEEAILFTIWG